jgi:uncharacterized protein (DUF2235 family)
MARNLISLIDGTMVSASRTGGYESYSNVFELACLLQLNDRSADGSPQIVFYTSGISSQPDTSSAYNLITGNSIKSQIVDQYTNICANFDFSGAQQGRPDKIYLFGFSRGAMAIRALAGLIAEFGLLHPRDIRHLPVILDRWDRTQGRGSVPDHIRMFPVEVDFVGLFDSVMGGVEWLPLFNPVRFSNSRFPGRCRHGVQILAIDENRRFFKPKPWQGRSPAMTASGERCGDRFLRQIWMPGVHSDIGGTADPVWGRASLLAMTFYLNKLTSLNLDPDWLREKEINLRASMDDGRLFIRPHKGPFTRFVRRPSGNEEQSERKHPLGDQVGRLNYRGREAYDWHQQILQSHFDMLGMDEDLAEYFETVLKGGKAGQTATAN